MQRRDFLKSTGSVLAALALNPTRAFCQPVPTPPAKPNFLFILVDDLGWRDIACYGSDFYDTPNVDQLAASAMKFTDGYAACPVCSPTRASIMAGKYPARMDTTDWFGAPQPDTAKNHWTRNKPLLPAPYVDRLPLEEVTLAEALHEAGYDTFFAGKWHLGETPEFWPEHQGFDVNKGGWLKGNPGQGGYFSPYNNPRLQDGPPGEHLPIRLARETSDFIAAHRDKPFLAYLSFYSVHTPLEAPESLIEKYQKKAQAMGRDKTPDIETRFGCKTRVEQDLPVYAAMVESMDAAVGNVLKTLDDLHLTDNTVVFFMSDNGGLATSEGSPTSNLPLRAGKGWLYEGGIREPWIVRWPGHTTANSLCHCPVISTDFYPTILDIANLPLRPEQHRDGLSIVPLLEGKQPYLDRPAIYWHYPHYGNQGAFPGSAIRKGPWKLIKNYESDAVELYNLNFDLGETNDLAKDRPDLAANLLADLNAWLKSVDAKFPTPNPNAAS